MAVKLPGFMFYPGDWLRDNVSGCSLAAQGLWLRMMILAHDSERYGYLQMNGVTMPPEFIARKCGAALDQYTTLLLELEHAGIPDRTPEGVIYSRRMVRDAKARTANAERQSRFRNARSNESRNACVTAMSENETEDEESKRGMQGGEKKPTPAPVAEGPPGIVVQVRNYLQNHPRLPPWHQRMQDNLVQLVTIKNWAYAEAAIEQNINEGSKDPIGDALRRVKRSAAKSDKAEADKNAVLGPTVTVKI